MATASGAGTSVRHVRHINARQIIDEMATPTDRVTARTYYHGTSDSEIGQKIVADGILKSPEIEDLNKRYGQSHLRPVEGRVYLSPSLRYAIIYALGGVFAGTDMPDSRRGKGGDYGYLFVVDGKSLTDVEPDEDTLGGLIGKLSHLDPSEYDDHPELTAALRADPDLVARLAGMLPSYLTPTMLRNVKDGRYAWYAKAGKRLLKLLPPSIRVKVAELGSAIGAQSSVPWTSAWRIAKSRSAELKKDGSNFFEVAEKVS